MPGIEEIQWFVRRGDQRAGPFSSETMKRLLRAGKIKPDDRVGHRGLTRWTKIQELPEFLEWSEQASDSLAPVQATPIPTVPTQAAQPQVDGPKFTFVAQVADPASGKASSVTVSASTVEQARAQVEATGMRVVAIVFQEAAATTKPQKESWFAKDSTGREVLGCLGVGCAEGCVASMLHACSIVTIVIIGVWILMR